MNPLNHPGVLQIPENNVEKRGKLQLNDVSVTNTGSDTDVTAFSTINSAGGDDSAPTLVLLKGAFGKFNEGVERLAGLEARDITRILTQERHDAGRKIKPRCSCYGSVSN